MRRALMLAAITALAAARPELYKEKEDFQFSRSSSDDGTKTGFYDAQRGNMGGNYERAHNMDSLAQHQMGGLVRNVQGELGDGAKQKSGSVYTAASTRGVYGSGNYDLSNLEGRNFQEGTSYGGSQSHSSLSSHNAGYGSQSYLNNGAFGSRSHNTRYSGYGATGALDQTQSLYNAQKSSDNLQSSSLYDETQAALNSGFSSQSGYHTQGGYDRSTAISEGSAGYGSNIRLVSAQPVRVYVRPGGRVALPIATQTVDSSRASTFDQNAINSEAEVLSNNDQHTVYKPTNNAKHYESSYSYRKEWEKHDTKPIGGVVAPVANPYPSNSELNEDIQAQGSENQHVATGQESRNAYSNQQSEYNIKSGSSSQSRYGSAYNAHQHKSASEAASDTAASSAYGAFNNNGGVSGNLHSGSLNNQVENFTSKPKSYQSSYSYHKSWERQGDPYIIKPSSNGLYTDAQGLQRLTDSSLSQGSSGYGSQSHTHSSHYHQGYNGVDCDENGHIRNARSYNLGQDQVAYQQSEDDIESQQSQQLQYFGQQPQNLADLGQQSQKLEDFSQQSQNLEDFGQQSQRLEDLGQQSQNLEDLSQQSQNLEDIGQQSQNLESFGQQSQNLEDFGQQSQNLESFGQQTQDLGQESQNLELLGQETQNQWDQQSQTDLGQESQNAWDTLETLQNSANDTAQQLTGIEHSGYTPPTNEASQKEEKVGQVSQPSDMDRINQPHSQISLEDISQPNHPVNPNMYGTHRQDMPGSESGFTHSDGMNHHTQYSWNSFQPGYPNEFTRPFPPHFHTFPHNVPDLQKQLETYASQLNTNYGNNQPGFADNAGYVNSWMNNPMYNMPHNNLHQDGYGNLGFPVNTYTNAHVNRHDQSSHSYTNIEVPTVPEVQESGSINNLWDMLNNIEKETTSGGENDSYDFNNSYQATIEDGQASNNSDKLQERHEATFEAEGKPFRQIPVFTSTTEHINIETIPVMQEYQPSEERGDIGPETTSQPIEDIGRGDIGPEDSQKDMHYSPVKPSDHLFERIPLPPNTKPIRENKTAEEIELSLTKESNKTTSKEYGLNTDLNDDVQRDGNQFENNLSVLSISDQKQLVQDNGEQNLQLSSTTTPKSLSNVEQGFTNTLQQSFDHQFQNTGQEVESQQSFIPTEDFDQQNMGDQIAEFGQQTQDTEQQLESFNQQNVNLDQQTINEHIFNLEQGPDDIHQQNMDQQFNLGQQSENWNQQSFSQFEEGQEKLHNFGQQNEEIPQANIKENGEQETLQQESLTAFDQQNENFNHPQKEQQLENWDQQNANFEQQSQVEDLNQQVQSEWKPAENLQQQPKEVETFTSPTAYQKEGREPHNQEPVIEPEIQKIIQNSAAETPPEPVTEKVGFWNKVGSKFVSAKDKVASWFSKSS